MIIHQNFDLTNYNSYRIEARCKVAYFPENETEIVELFKTNQNFILLGSGHNIIFSKAYYDESFIIFNGNFNDIDVENSNGIIIAEAGATMLEISKKALEEGLSGVEVFYDIPSSLGGAVVMNAGASGEEVKDILLKVRYLDLDTFEISEIENEAIGFEYRNSLFQQSKSMLVLKAWLQLKPLDKNLIHKKMEDMKQKRWAKQPKKYPNAGSVFKRPKGFYVGAMIDELSLKGFTIGGAKISEKHGGFIVNFNNAKGGDVVSIIRHVQTKVKDRFNVDLEVEQRII
ncbi:UDP-N-acetylmuramate dehydrogenase [Winogradskyella sp.]|uniref:UDP-N-acetylmuramate dehydrogenase n=1 Tax=Winogradskyella sp. TaxID=1883156 RepID=UPI003AB74B81